MRVRTAPTAVHAQLLHQLVRQGDRADLVALDPEVDLRDVVHLQASPLEVEVGPASRGDLAGPQAAVQAQLHCDLHASDARLRRRAGREVGAKRADLVGLQESEAPAVLRADVLHLARRSGQRPPGRRVPQQLVPTRHLESAGVPPGFLGLALLQVAALNRRRVQLVQGHARVDPTHMPERAKPLRLLPVVEQGQVVQVAGPQEVVQRRRAPDRDRLGRRRLHLAPPDPGQPHLLGIEQDPLLGGSCLVHRAQHLGARSPLRIFVADHPVVGRLDRSRADQAAHFDPLRARFLVSSSGSVYGSASPPDGVRIADSDRTGGAFRVGRAFGGAGNPRSGGGAPSTSPAITRSSSSRRKNRRPSTSVRIDRWPRSTHVRSRAVPHRQYRAASFSVK